MRIFADFSGTIAIPAVAAALLGKWLDGKFGTDPLYLLLLLAAALFTTALIMVRKARKYLSAYEALMKNEK